MDVHLPDEFANRVNRHVDPERGVTPLTVLQKAMDCFEASSNTQFTTDDAEKAIEKLRGFRGALQETTVEETLKDRREGLT